MSWARDEWKLDLPTTALRKISELENDAENLRKSKQQQQFQLESLSSTLQKQKQLNTEEKASNSNLRREIQELSRKCSDLESQEEKTQLDLKAKDTKIGLLEEQLRKAKAKLKDEEDKNSELLNQIDQQKLVVEAKENEVGELTEELKRTKDTKAQMMKDMEVTKEKIDNLFQENEALRDQLRQRDELLTTHSRDQSMVENEVEPIADTADLTSSEAVGSAFLEILKKENNALISDNEELKAQVEHLKGMLREKEKELERVMEKLAASHAECEKTTQTLKTREKEIVRLQAKLDRAEGELRNTHNRVETLQEKSKQLYEEIQSEKCNTDETKEKFVALSRALEDSENKIKTLETDLTQRLNQVKAKRERVETLEDENAKLTQELDYLRRQNSAASESYFATNKQLREKDHRIQALEDDYKEKQKQLKIQGEKVEILTSENNRLNEELERTGQKCMNAERSYRRVSKALEDCRKKFQGIDIGQDLWEKERDERLELNSREDLKDNGDQTSLDKETKKCSNCNQLKGKLHEQQNSYELKLRELEACIRDLTAEKEALKQNADKERRSSEEFTNRVQQMVQELETGQKENQLESDENRRGKLQEKENFFNMVKRFFAEHEGLKDHAQKCLSDLRQLQEYFQGCSNGAKDVISHAHAFETVAKRMSLLKSLLESVVNELGRPMKEEECDIEGNEDVPLEAGIRPEMSWDDYEREVAYKTFKGDVEDILQQIETDKKRFEKKAEELHEVKRAHMALKKVRKRSRQAIERALTHNDIEDFHEEEPGQDNQAGSQQTNTRMDGKHGEDLVEVIKQLLDQNREELELKISGHFNSLEKTIKQNPQPVVLPDERRQKFGSENTKDAIDGKYAIGELDLVKRKLSDVQKSIKHLIGSLAEIEREKNSVESKMDLLNGELSRKDSQCEAISEELKRTTRTASEDEISFRNRLDALSSEKDQINSELRRIVGILKEKELELVAKSQQLKNLQTAFKDEERAMKNKLDSLEQENNSLWLDYKEADKRAEIKEKEFKELSERLKKSQGYIHSVFSSLTNMDDELQKARDIEVFSEQDFN